KDRDDGLAGSELLGEPDRAGDVDAGRAAEAQAFVLEQLVDHRYGFLVRNQEGVVDLRGLDDGRDAAQSDPFGDGVAGRRLGGAILEQLVHCEAVRIRAGVDDTRV